MSLFQASKILVVGLGPLLEKGVTQFGGQCLRTWCFVKPLLDDGHKVRLVTLNMEDPPNTPPALVRHNYEDFEYQGFTNYDLPFIHKTLLQVARSFSPDAIVAVNNLPAWVTAKLPLIIPFWADTNGYQMAEKQGQAARTGKEDVLMEAWSREALTARRADKFSTVSRTQLHALLGEMASLGRMNQHTFHYHFAHRIPEPFHPEFVKPVVRDEESLVLRGNEVPEDAFILLWSGAYNYWTDPDFMFQCVDSALRLDERIHFVSTGGGVKPYNTLTYETFQSLAEGSDCKDRYHFLGWVPAENLPGIYEEADLAFSMDEPNYETLFGARNRLTNLMAAGTPVLTTYGSEVSQDIMDGEAGVVVEPNNEGEFVEAVRFLFRNPAWLKKFADKGRAFARKHWAPEKVTEPLRQWAMKPELSPDNAAKVAENTGLRNLLDVHTNPLEEAAAIIEREGSAVAELPDAMRDYQIIQKKAWYPILSRLGHF